MVSVYSPLAGGKSGHFYLVISIDEYCHATDFFVEDSSIPLPAPLDSLTRFLTAAEFLATNTPQNPIVVYHDVLVAKYKVYQ